MASLKELERRIARLEALLIKEDAKPAQPAPLGLYLVAFAGGWRPDSEQSVAECYSAAAGYDSTVDMRVAMRDPAEFGRRHVAAVNAMLEKVGGLDGVTKLIEQAEAAGMPLPPLDSKPAGASSLAA